MTAKLNASKLGSYGSVDNGDGENEPFVRHAPDPIDAPPWLSRLTFGWLSPLLELGNTKRRLDVDDLREFPLPHDDRTAQVMEQFHRSWSKEVRRGSSNESEPTLALVLWNAYYLDFCTAGILKLIHDLFQFVGPQVLKGLIIYIRTPNAPFWHGIGLTLAVVAAQIIMSITLRHYYFMCYRVGLRIRTAVITAIYRKSLVLAGSHKEVGEITNLMSTDAQRLQDIVTYLHSLWYSILQITLALLFLWQQMGVSILSGVLVIILSIPLTAISAAYMGRMQQSLMTAKDRRIELINEVLGNMKVVKLQAWEMPFREKVESLRKIELRHLLWYLIGRMFTFLTFAAVPLTISLATFGTYVLLGNQLDVASALTSLALFEILRFPLFMFPQTINGMVEANVALRRISSFLASPEHHQVPKGSLKDIGFKMHEASFAYESDRNGHEKNEGGVHPLLPRTPNDNVDQGQRCESLAVTALEGQENDSPDGHSLCLSRIDLVVGRGEFIAVVGGVGCGKTTLLKSLMGELAPVSGSVSVRGNIAYSAQSPFIMNATVKENILFGDIDSKIGVYEKALQVCALEHDLNLLPNGDMTEIGEKGITLSGGQKARIGLARALYHDADIFLLDDPLAAVDANVGRQLFDNCIVGSMVNPDLNRPKRTVVLVTNALQYLSHPQVDRIIVLKEGNIVETGTFKELHGDETSQFKRYLNSFNKAKTGGPSGDSTTHVVGEVSKLVRDHTVVMNRTPSEREVVESDGRVVLMTDELLERETGTVSLAIYLAWVKAAGGLWIVLVLTSIFSCAEGSKLLSNWWLTYWSAHGSEGLDSQVHFLKVYACINVLAIAFSVTESVVVMLIGLRASRQLFSRVLDAVMRAPMSFFDTTPLGRIINRFSKDMYTVDESLPDSLETYLFCLFEVLSTLVVVSVVTPSFTACILPIMYLYHIEQKYFTVSYRELRRLDSVQRSPVYALFGETLDGASTIRAFKAESTLLNRMVTMLDSQQHAYFLTVTAQSWLGMRLELIGTCIVFAACLAAVVEHDGMGGDATFAGLAGLSISYALSATQSLNWTVRVGSEFEANMISVERLEQYSRLQSEAPSTTELDRTIAKAWPRKGDIEFQRVTLRYRPDLPLVLKGLTLHIPCHSKVGIVGRTGAGKSTLMAALMRLVEIETGKILIDGVDLKSLGLQCVRSNIAVIPQDPVLFSGSVRTNLDPFDKFSDDRICNVLERVGLLDASNSKGPVKSLDDKVTSGGSNFSVGQRQLMVIGRALLARASVIICDEATAAVDAETDARMQKLFRSDFANATCLTVAHRLNTIMDSDYVLVIDDGKAAEFDAPHNLLRAKDGIFKRLVETWEKEHDN